MTRAIGFDGRMVRSSQLDHFSRGSTAFASYVIRTSSSSSLSSLEFRVIHKSMSLKCITVTCSHDLIKRLLGSRKSEGVTTKYAFRLRREGRVSSSSVSLLSLELSDTQSLSALNTIPPRNCCTYLCRARLLRFETSTKPKRVCTRPASESEKFQRFARYSF